MKLFIKILVIEIIKEIEVIKVAKMLLIKVK
jgi:hypothetical protein